MIAKTDMRFWITLSLFLVVFGLSIFAITRHIYSADADADLAQAYPIEQPATAWEDRALALDAPNYASPGDVQALGQDPVALSAQANGYFANNQYTLAAEAYQRLLAFDPGNVNVLNNLGLTLHYLGRSDEALERLLEGSRLDPLNQRLWLTLGYVSSETGNIAQARSALTTAAKMGPGTAVGISASRMLEALP